MKERLFQKMKILSNAAAGPVATTAIICLIPVVGASVMIFGVLPVVSAAVCIVTGAIGLAILHVGRAGLSYAPYPR